MSFSPLERQALLRLPGVGQGVLRRLELIGMDSLEKLACAEPEALLGQLAACTSCGCWVRSGKAGGLIARVVDFAARRASHAPGA